jgi:hypothetical protein
MTDAAAILRRQIAVVRREVDALEAMLAEIGVSDTPISNGATALSADDLQAVCIERGFLVSADGFIRESHAAALRGVSKSTMRRWREEGPRIPYRQRGGRYEYNIEVLAADFSEK